MLDSSLAEQGTGPPKSRPGGHHRLSHLQHDDGFIVEPILAVLEPCDVGQDRIGNLAR